MQKVTVFTNKNCMYCRHTKEFLEKHKVTYQERNVSEDPQAALYLMKRTKQYGVPVIIIQAKDSSEEVIIGFDRKKLRDIVME